MAKILSLALRKMESVESLTVEEYLEMREEDGLVHEREEDGTLYVERPMVRAADPTKPITLEEAQRLAEAIGLEWDEEVYSTEGQPNVIPVWSSDERVDRHGDIVEQTWDLDEYALNAVVLFQHDWRMPPVGNAIRSKVMRRNTADIDGYTGKSLHQLLLFPRLEEWSWSMSIFRLMKHGIMPSVSVGFRPGEVVRITDPEEREEIGLPEYGAILRKNKLLEVSSVTIPANPGARISRSLRKAAQAGELHPADVQVLREMTRRGIKKEKGDSSQWAEADARLLTFWKALGHCASLPKHKELDVPLLLDAIHDEVVRSRPKQETDEMDKEVKEALDKLDDKIAELGDAVSSLSDEMSAVQESVTNLGATLDAIKESVSESSDEPAGDPDDTDPDDDDAKGDTGDAISSALNASSKACAAIESV